MSLIFRLLYVVLSAFRRSRLRVLESGRIWLRVWPNDLDIFMHVNNGRYLTLMDLGRTDLIVRNGIVAAMRQRKWTIVVAGATVNYKRPLTVWKRFQMDTRIVGWDERSIYMQQELYFNAKLMASGMIRMMVRDANGGVPSATVMAAIGHNAPSPPLPLVAAQLSGTQIVQQATTVSVQAGGHLNE